MAKKKNIDKKSKKFWDFTNKLIKKILTICLSFEARGQTFSVILLQSDLVTTDP